MISLSNILAIALGGALGAVLRAYSVHFTNKFVPLEFPLGILLVNILGSFLIGICFALFSHYTISDTLKSFLTTGFLGALTTYSTFAIESYLLFGTSIYLAILNIVLNVSGTILASGFAYRLFQYILK